MYRSALASRSILRRTLSPVMLFLALASLLALTGSRPGRAATAPDSLELTAAQAARVDAEVRRNLATAGAADFFVVLSEQADLAPAYALTDKAARGQFVFAALRATAAETQPAVRAALDAARVPYQPFYISNKIFVQGGSPELVAALAARTDVARLAANNAHQLPTPEPGAKAPAGILAIEPNLAFVNADDVWALGDTGEGAVLAGNDTGIQWDHPALKNQYRGWNGSSADHNYNWWDATGTYPSAPGDGNGHGTHTTGTMVGDDGAGNQIGMAPGARTIHCKNLDDFGSGWDVDIIECFQWDLAPWDLSGANPRPDLAPDAINNSWGGWGGNPAFSTEIAALQAAGIVVEFSAGNNGPSCGTLGSPGDFESVLTTGSVNHQAAFPGTVTSFSSRGPSAFTETPIPDVMAPGENIRSSLPGGSYGSYSGTSMSGPHVTGLVGLLIGANPGLRGFVPEIQQLIMDTAVPLSGQLGSSCGGDYTTGPNNDWGHGTIDALAAVQAARQFGAPGTLAGQITNSANGGPLAGATVRAALSPQLSWKSLSDASGLYNMLVFSGTYTVTASLYGSYPQTISGVSVLTDQTTTLDFALDPAPFYTVSGVVRDADTGWPLYARINVAGYPGPAVWTDPQTGQYSISLAAGVAYTFSVIPWSEGYYSVSQAVGPLSADIGLDFDLTADTYLCSAPGYQPQFLYFEDFEADDGGYTITGDYTSWQWGEPRSGPNRAHSGQNVWATGLNGNYLTNEWGYIVSPPMNMSAFANDQIVVSWWQWLNTEGGFDFATVEVSNDGGASWQSVYGPISGPISMQWEKQTIYLDGASFAVPDFQVRFGLWADYIFEFPGFYVDDVGIGIVSLPPALYSQDFEAGDGAFAAAGTNSSWAWGTPTRGPGAAHSGSYAWATNLGGNYNNDENSALTSPALDLSAAAGQPLVIDWWNWVQTEAGYDTFRIEFSADDGATWTPYYVWSGPVHQAWEYASAYLDPSYAVANFRVRFALESDSSVTYPGAYVDDLAVRPYVPGPPSVACLPGSGSLVFGHVVDANTGQPLNGATVTNPAGARLATAATPDDPARPDGFYATFAAAGAQVLSAGKADYGTVVTPITVPAGGAVPLDFDLPAGRLAATPAGLTASLALGESTTLPLSLGNDGGLAVEYEIRERNVGFLPLGLAGGQGAWLYQSATGVPLRRNDAAQPEGLAYPAAYRWEPATPAGSLQILVYADDPYHPAPGTYVDQALQRRQLPYVAHYNADFGGFEADLLAQTWDLVIFANDNWYPPDSTLGALNAYVLAGGKLAFGSWTVGFNPSHPLFSTLGAAWVADDIDPPDPAYWWEPDHPLFTRLESVPEFTALERSRYFVYGQRLQPLEGFEALAGTTTPGPDPDRASLVLGNGGTTLFRGFMDGQNDADLDTDGTPDGVELWLNTIDGIQTEFSYDVDWLATDIVSGTLPAGSDQPLSVTLDAAAASVTQPGVYQATLRVVNDTPYGFMSVPVELTVAAPADWGKVSGVVTGLARCDFPGAPLNRAAVTVDGAVNLSTGADGAYGYWLPAGSHNLVISQPGYLSQTYAVTVTAGVTTVRNANLRPLTPCATYGPLNLAATLQQGEQTSATLTLQNNGAGALTFEILETDFDFGQTPALAPRLPAANPASGRYTAPTVTGPTSVRAAGAPEAATTGPVSPLSAWFGGLDLPGGAVRYGFAQCAEQLDSVYVISGVNGTYSLTPNSWRYDAGTNSWTALQPLPTAVEAPAAACYQGRLYVMGGGGSNQFYIYDLVNNVWLAGSPLPRGVEGAAAAAWDGKVYLIGGDDDFFPGSGVSDRVDVYDIASDNWTGTGAPMPVASSMAGAAQAGPYVYVVGGWGVLAPEGNVNATMRYDMRSDSWEVGPTFESARADFALAVTNQALYALGGDEDGGFFFEATSQAERLALADWPGGAWAPLADSLPAAVSANSGGFCTRALLNPDVPEIGSIGGGDASGFITGRVFFQEMAGERCYSLYQDLPWLTPASTRGTVPGDQAGAVAVTLDAAALAAGEHRATLVVVTNDGGAAQIRIPIVLTVTPLYRLHLPVFVYRSDALVPPALPLSPARGR